MFAAQVIEEDDPVDNSPLGPVGVNDTIHDDDDRFSERVEVEFCDGDFEHGEVNGSQYDSEQEAYDMDQYEDYDEEGYDPRDGDIVYMRAARTHNDEQMFAITPKGAKASGEAPREYRAAMCRPVWTGVCPEKDAEKHQCLSA
ncbi:hypothetical protein PLICRDRAFT_28926 [Plicaturopsis crispa FD-325 SS-3]|nr:hypothetical protein PLICRDRAFT_28926 [Plicaturopsis crispa FD-325 SS-3]